MSRRLCVWYEDRLVGTISTDRGAWSFVYAPGWLRKGQTLPLSPGFPLRPEPFEDDAIERPVQWFFDNLLPEGALRKAHARVAKVDDGDALGLLRAYGADTAGAFALLPEGQTPRREGPDYQKISTEEFRAMVADAPKLPWLQHETSTKMSLAGAQRKIGMHRQDDGSLFLPMAAPSTWIAKPDNARPERFPFCPANEHFCMSLGARMGLRVPTTRLMHLPEAVYWVERYDRDKESRKRIHQIDLCQALGKWPAYKYEGDGGVDVVEAYGALAITRQPAVARREFLRRFVFNYLVGNSDAHGKNLAFIYLEDGKLTLAPAYDLLCVRVYGDDYLAMSIGGESRYLWVEESHWQQMAADIGLNGSFWAKLRREMATQIPGMAQEVLQSGPWTADESNFLEDVVKEIDTLSQHLLSGLGGA